MQNIVIRKMTIDDIASVSSLEAKCLGQEAWSEKSFVDILEKDYYEFYLAFATINDELRHIATVGFTKSLDEADVSNVCVDENFRGRGVAYKLLSGAINEMVEKGVLHFTLEVRERNSAAINLYKKLGFESAGVRPNFYNNPADNAVIMWKHIDN